MSYYILVGYSGKYKAIMKKILILLFMLYSGVIFAQETSDSVQVYFRQGYASLDLSFSGNRERLNLFISNLQQLRGNALYRIVRMRVVGCASPEGSVSLNNNLANKRAENLLAWVEKQVSLEGVSLEVTSVGIDWQGLEELVITSEMPYKKEVLDILRKTPEMIAGNVQIESWRKRQLVMLHGGIPWQYMEKIFFPKLRNASLRVVYEIEPVDVLESLKPTAKINLPVPEIIPLNLSPLFNSTSRRKSFYMAIKTNLLYDAILVPNIGAEFHLSNNWTIGGNWVYAWWKNDQKHNYWRIYGGDLFIRKYFGIKAQEKPLTGHHVGLYVGIATYDFELGSRGYLGDKWSYHSGIEYGYSLPIARRMNLDFTLGVGYLGGQFMEYQPIDNHYVWQATKKRHWFGPTKAEVSLVWLIGYGNINKKKGIER